MSILADRNRRAMNFRATSAEHAQAAMDALRALRAAVNAKYAEQPHRHRKGPRPASEPAPAPAPAPGPSPAPASSSSPAPAPAPVPAPAPEPTAPEVRVEPAPSASDSRQARREESAWANVSPERGRASRLLEAQHGQGHHRAGSLLQIWLPTPRVESCFTGSSVRPVLPIATTRSSNRSRSTSPRWRPTRSSPAKLDSLARSWPLNSPTGSIPTSRDHATRINAERSRRTRPVTNGSRPRPVACMAGCAWASRRSMLRSRPWPITV